MFMGACINDGLYYTTLTSLTRLSLLNVAGNFIDHLGSLVNMRDLHLFGCSRIKNDWVETLDIIHQSHKT